MTGSGTLPIPMGSSLLQQLVDFRDDAAALGERVDFDAKGAEVQRQAGIREDA